jgi:tetratricopeptide (TPR) repeat protein
MPTAHKKTAKSSKTAPPKRRVLVSAAKTRSAKPGRAPSRKQAPPEPPKPKWTEQYEGAVHDYEKGVRLVNEKKHAEALGVFDSLITRFGRESDLLDIVDRARSFHMICERHTAGHEPKSSEDKFLRSVYHSNLGQFDEALKLLEEALPTSSEADKVLYAMAAVHALKSERDPAIDKLKRAIEKNERNRVYAMNDSDFDPIRDEPEFINLVEPEEAGGRSREI